MTARAYAEGTAVSVEKSKAEIDSILTKHGATQRGIMADDVEGRAQLAFVLKGHHYRIDVPLPKILDFAPKRNQEPRGWYTWGAERRESWTRERWEQGCRERWRAVVLMLKAKLELVRLGVSTIEREFMADMVLPGGRTVGAIVADQIEGALAGGPAPRLLGTGT